MTVLMFFGNDFIDYRFKKIATKAMQLECAKNCASHGVRLDQLIGPKVLEKKEHRLYEHFVFSWQTKTNPIIILKLDYTSLKGDPDKFNFQWMPL